MHTRVLAADQFTHTHTQTHTQKHTHTRHTQTQAHTHTQDTTQLCKHNINPGKPNLSAAPYL